MTKIGILNLLYPTGASVVKIKYVYSIQKEKQGINYWKSRQYFLVLLRAYKAEESHGMLLYVDIMVKRSKMQVWISDS